jgi:hypothetical protein
MRHGRGTTIGLLAIGLIGGGLLTADAAEPAGSVLVPVIGTAASDDVWRLDTATGASFGGPYATGVDPRGVAYDGTCG